MKLVHGISWLATWKCDSDSDSLSLLSLPPSFDSRRSKKRKQVKTSQNKERKEKRQTERERDGKKNEKIERKRGREGGRKEDIKREGEKGGRREEGKAVVREIERGGGREEVVGRETCFRGSAESSFCRREGRRGIRNKSAGETRRILCSS